MSIAPDPLEIGPHRIGLGRLFTSQGVDPYDEVVWDRRDARITNWTDGTVAFEQLGVEFPAHWSQNATNIVAQKYFRGTLGTPGRESSLRQVVDRVVDTITRWGIEGSYFADDSEASAFADELKYTLVTQRAAFNSPVWFNIGVDGVPQQASACYILEVDDTMDSILEWYRQEGLIFKGGSGAGTNLSKIRSSAEHMTGGGTASGPVSFMRGADASAGTIKSGGKTRRAAKMVILNADHPDIDEFVACKAIEERKVRVLRDAGFDMDLDGKDSFSVQYQNANNSVRVADEFMQAVIADGAWDLKAVKTGETIRTIKARDLWRRIAEAAWECADPGLQFDTTINRWHTLTNTGPIEASNPCFPGDTLVHTNKGLIAFRELFERANEGEEFGVYTHDVTNPGAPESIAVITTPEAYMITGRNPIVRLRFSSGAELRCTPSHRIFTTNRGFVEAKDLTADDHVRSLDVPTPAVNAEWAMPICAEPEAYWTKRDPSTDLRFPEVWSQEFAHYLGWLIGDGCTSNTTTSTIYGSAEDRTEILPGHEDLIRWINGDRPLKVSEQSNGTVQLRLSRRAFERYLERLGIQSVTGEHKTVPWSIEQAPPEIVAAFLRGLFDADGCAVNNPVKGSYVGLGSISIELLRGAQRLLSTFGITSRIYGVKRAGSGAFSYTRKDGTFVESYRQHASFDLRITGVSMERFAAQIGFQLSRKAQVLDANVNGRTRPFYETDNTIRLSERIDEGIELTYNLREPRNHSYVANGIVVRNCSEFLSINNSACNLASVNLMPFLDHDRFDVGAFKHTVELVFTAQEILVGRADYPTEKLTQNSYDFRQLGLGYTNLGAMLMALGLPYDSLAGRAWAAAITSLMTGHAYATSARTAARIGPFAGFAENEEHMLRVLSMHRDAAYVIEGIDAVPPYVVRAGHEAWEAAVRDGEEHGVRNSQATVLAPTGCLVGGTLVATDHGLVRLASLGNPGGPQWQDADCRVLTDDGPQDATKFFVNGLERVVEITTGRGYQIQGTATHRIRVLDDSNDWVWRRFSDLRPGDRVPLARGQMLGQPTETWLPPISETLRWAREHHVYVPDIVDSELAELVGYFMGDGSLHSRGLRFCVANDDVDVIEHIVRLGKSVFGIQAATTQRPGYVSVEFHSVRLVNWWQACGFAKREPHQGHSGKGYVPHIPDAILHTNDPDVYSAFIRGLFEADGTVTMGYPHWMTSHVGFATDVQTLLLALGFVTTRRQQLSRMGSRIEDVRLLNRVSSQRWMDEIGFISDRKARLVDVSDCQQAARYDHIPVTRALIERALPANGRDRRAALMEHRRTGSITRRLATSIFESSQDAELGHLLGFFYDRVLSSNLGDEEFTYDLSVPSNVTYVANGFVSHNTISFMMDADTTGIEPDLSLVKTKKLVGGGTMSIVNQTVPRALAHLGYDEEQVADIVAYIDHEKSVIGAPHLAAEHLPVFACSMGDNTIHYEGHVRMLAAVQPFISGAVSKTTNMPESSTVEEIEHLHQLAWELGLKSIAIYRDNCKVGQPLSTTKKVVITDPETQSLFPVAGEGAGQIVERIVEKVVHRPIRQKLPRNRRGRTFEFRVADCKGFLTVGEYDDGRPGEVFLTVSKQGSTLAGIMDAFAKSISYGLQYGVPLRAFVEAFTNMRFEPAGITDDPEIRFASSVMDYLFRKLAMEYLSYEERAELSIFSVTERLQPTLPGMEESIVETTSGTEMVTDPKTLPTAGELADQMNAGTMAATPVDNTPAAGVIRDSDAPMCMQCGVTMIRVGSCHACPSCGSTSGCS